MKKRKTALILKRTGAAILSSLLTLACAAGMFACADTGRGEGEDSATSDAGTATSAAPEESTEAALTSAPEGDGTSDAGTGEGPAAGAKHTAKHQQTAARGGEHLSYS